MKNLFNSYTLPIPPVRFDIQRIPIDQNGHNLIHFFDSMGYATPDFALPQEAEAILSLFDGTYSVEEILKLSSNEVSREQVLGYARFLDEHGILYSEYFWSLAENIETEYENSPYHRNTTSGISYPSDHNDLIVFLDKAFDLNEQLKAVDTAKALYAPHIDPRVGMSSYVKAFSTIKNLKPKKVVVLATSHYAGLHEKTYEEAPFIISNKRFQMPNGEVNSDTEFIDRLKELVEIGASQSQTQILKQAQDDLDSKSHFKYIDRNANIDPTFLDASNFGISFQDRAHRVEHSIELHLLFLNYIWNHDFKIIPVLVGSLDELFYTKNSFREHQLNAFSKVLQELDDPDTFFLISGDLSHVGHKFGDERTASKMFDEVKINDNRFLEIGASGNPNKLISLMKEEFDRYRICGFPPLLTFKKTFPNIIGEVLSYDLWDERERESAVTFGSILFK